MLKGKTLFRKRARGGFTLIELVVVVVILGILAAIALPKYADVSREANEAMLTNLGLAIEQASSNNRMAYALGHPGAVQVNTNACTRQVSQSLLSSPIPASANPNLMFVTITGASCSTPGTPSMQCRLTSRSGITILATTGYSVHCAGN